MSAILAKPEQFIRDLDRVSATLAPTPKVDGFLTDLDRVHRQTAADQEPFLLALDYDLSGLAHQFDAIRSWAFEKLGGSQWLENLPTYDPLCCRVSLFGTLDLGLRETAHTRALAYLLNRDEDHGFGDILLRAFLKQIFGWNDVRQLTDVQINSELRSGESRDRLDIFMSGRCALSAGKVETWMVIVEAKIDADEAEDQLARYEDQLYEKIASSDYHALVFLTPDGREPTTDSKGGGPKWTPLSFIKLMAQFRQRLPKLSEQPEFGYLRHYMTGVLKDLYRLNCGNFSKKVPDTNEIYRICEYLSLETTGGK